MVHYIIKRKDDNLLVRKGGRGRRCYAIEAAKTFRYLAQAQNYIASMPDADQWVTVKIER